jgi:CMP-N-acetylneuraminic acid synthetase
MQIVAFVPARSGSKRVPNKNIRLLRGHPLLAYSIASAKKSGVFAKVYLVTDSAEYHDIALRYGADLFPQLRPADISGDTSPDIDWVRWALNILKERNEIYDAFSILRPTSPFRTAETIQRAVMEFKSLPDAHSLRAVEMCSQHPGKMWVIGGSYMLPLLPFTAENGQPWHSNQYASLPKVLVQNASLEIAKASVAVEQNNISGSIVVPFITSDTEGVDVNSEDDWND